jgi:hypothetical protein
MFLPIAPDGDAVLEDGGSPLTSQFRVFADNHQDTCITRCTLFHIPVTVLRAYTTR